MASGLEVPTKELAHKLKNETGMSKEEIREAVEQTKEKYSPLLTSNKTALMLYARKYKGIQIVEKTPPDLDIKNIVPDMQEVNLQATVKDIDQFSYRKDGEQKKACDLTIKDNTGEISLMLWGEQIQEAQELEKEDSVELRNAYSNEYQGETQLGWSDGTTIEVI